MLNTRNVEKLLTRFPYLFQATDREPDAAAARLEADRGARLVNSLLRLLSSLFLSEVTRRGLGDDRVVRFLDNELDEPPLGRWISFQRVLLEEPRVPFEEVFSLDYKRRDSLQLLNKRYLDYLEQLEAVVSASDAAPNAGSERDEAEALAEEFIEFLLTYFKSELVETREGTPEAVRLVNRDREQGFRLYPLVRGGLDELEVFSGVTTEGLVFHSLVTDKAREITDPRVLEEFGEVFLRIGAYGQAIATFEKLGRAGAMGPEDRRVAYATHCRQGTDCYRRGKYHQAILEFDKAMQVRADLHVLHYHLALAYARLSNYNRAIQLLARLVENNPALDRGYELLGDLYQMKGEPSKARRQYDKAFIANPYNKSVERKRRKLSEERPAARAKGAAAKPKAEEPAENKSHDLLIDLTQKAAAGELHPIIGRDAELESMIEILCCQMRSNPLLIGEPGVGKTAIVEELAIRLHRDQVPRVLRGKKLYLMSVASLLAGAKFRGQFEERVLQLVETLKSEPCILFIDDIHTIVNSGLSKGGTLDTSSLLKPALVRGEIQAIGATTYDEFRANIEKDPSLVRSFQSVEIEEPTPELAKPILALHAERLSVHHGVIFEDLDFAEISQLIKICLRERRLPDIAINVLDRAAARVCLKGLAQAKTPGEPELPSVGREDVAEVLAEMSGVPVARLSAHQSERFLHMDELLADRVVGQEDAVQTVAHVMRTTKMNLDLHEHRPDGVFLFVGPSGVGKTELARSLAEFLFGDEDKLIRVDMSEYMEKISSSRLIGAAPGYVGYNDQNQLTDQVRKSPYCVLLLDEIEKADSQMLNLFLQVFDAGRLTDGKGRTVHFDNATIIMTSNVGTQLYSQARAGYAEGRTRAVTSSELMKEVKRFFPPEFLNRIDEVVFFRQLDKEDLKSIVRLQLKELTERLERRGIELALTDEVYQMMARLSYSPEFGARNLSRIIRRRILDPLAAQALSSSWEKVTSVLVDSNDDDVVQVSLTIGGGEALEPVELPEAAESEAAESDLEALQ